MGWGRFLLLGDLGQQLDVQEQADTIARLRRSAANDAGKNWEQDQQIEELFRENTELKHYISQLVSLLSAKGIFSHDDLERLVSSVERFSDASPAAPPEGEEDARPSEELSAISDAVARARASGKAI